MPAPRENFFTKTITFSNAAGSGAVGTVALCTITGGVFVRRMTIRCSTSLTGSSATISLGTASSATALIGSTTATALTAGLHWTSTTPATTVSAIVDKVLDENLIITVGTAAVTAGVIELEVYYQRSTSDGVIS